MTRRQMIALLGAVPLTVATGCAKQKQPGASASEQNRTKTEQPELILRYAENQPENYPTTQAAHYFAKMVDQCTQGRVRILVYSGAELGAEQSVIEQMQFGGIDFSRISLSQLAEYEPQLSVLQLPYLYEDAEQMWRVLDGRIGNEFLSMLGAMDLVGLSWFDAGVRSFYTCKKVTGLEGLKGLTLRVQESDLMCDLIRALGANPVQMAYSKVYAALHNAEIDGAENNWPSYEAMGHYEVAPYFLKDEHTRVPELQVASVAALEKLQQADPEFPSVIRMCAKESALYERALWAEQEKNSEDTMRSKGITVTPVLWEEKEKFRAAVKPIYDAFADQNEMIERIRST